MHHASFLPHIAPCPFCRYAGTTKDRIPYYDTLAPGRLVITCGNCGASGPEHPTARLAAITWEAHYRAALASMIPAVPAMTWPTVDATLRNEGTFVRPEADPLTWGDLA